MTTNTQVQPNALTDVRNSRKLTRRARISMALAGTGMAGAMLLGGIFGGHASAASVQASTSLAATNAQVQTAPLSYRGADSYRGIAWQAARRAGINSTLFIRQIQQESGFNPYAHSPAGAIGIAQFMPATAASMGVDPWNPTSSLYGAARMMAQLDRQFGGNYAKALAAYNAGPGAVYYAVRHGGGNWLAWTPAETQHYVRVIMG